MGKNVQKDNDLYDDKVRQRQVARLWLDTPPLVLEAYGGWGKLGDACYYDIPFGIVLEKNGQKTAALGLKRPTWAVYETDTVTALTAGVGSQWEVNWLDVDPYGDPHPTIQAFFKSDRPRAKTLVIVVHDALKNVAMMGKAWKVETLAPLVEKYGNKEVAERYLDMCRELITTAAEPHGYEIDRWWGVETGHHKKQALYTARLRR